MAFNQVVLFHEQAIDLIKSIFFSPDAFLMLGISCLLSDALNKCLIGIFNFFDLQFKVVFLADDWLSMHRF